MPGPGAAHNSTSSACCIETAQRWGVMKPAHTPMLHVVVRISGTCVHVRYMCAGASCCPSRMAPCASMKTQQCRAPLMVRLGHQNTPPCGPCIIIPCAASLVAMSLPPPHALAQLSIHVILSFELPVCAPFQACWCFSARRMLEAQQLRVLLLLLVVAGPLSSALSWRCLWRATPRTTPGHCSPTACRTGPWCTTSCGRCGLCVCVRVCEIGGMGEECMTSCGRCVITYPS